MRQRRDVLDRPRADTRQSEIERIDSERLHQMKDFNFFLDRWIAHRRRLQSIAQAFVRLQEARHEADYDLERSWTRPTAQELVEVARKAFERWAQIRRSHEANVFALALLSVKLFDKDR